MGKNMTNMSEINRTMRAMKSHKDNRIDNLVDLEYSKCFNQQKKKMENFKPKPSKYTANGKFMNRDGAHQRSQSSGYHLDGKKDIKVFNNTYKKVFLDKDKKTRNKIMKMFK
jgi:deoxycytidine triphosphate deaminase